MITVYHLDNSRSERIVWLLEELGVKYEQQVFMRENGAAPAAMRAIHPSGKAPLVRDGDQVLMESGAIVEWLLLRHGNGRLVPKSGTPEHARYLQWLHYAEGSAMSALLGEFFVQLALGEAAKQHPFAQGLLQRRTAMLQLIDAELGKGGYFAGSEFTAADIMMEHCFVFLERMNFQPLDAYNNIVAWLQRVRARPAHQRAMAVAGPKVKLMG